LRDNAAELFGHAPSEDLLRQLVSQAVPDDPCSVRVTLVADQAAVLAGTEVTPEVAVTVSDPRPPEPPALSVRTTRYARETPHLKHRGTHGLTRETRTARLAGFDDALLVGPDGNVTEGTTWNLLLHDGGSWVWPAALMLPGVTAALLRAAMEQSGTAHRTEPVDAHDVPAYAAAFALNASVPGRVIAAVDGHPQATAQLRQLWDSVIPEPLA
jgi:branched-subunit amino acid aminotransferase/4-amino-4-deoxychorismate lyase